MKGGNRERFLDEAMAIIAEGDGANLSLREVARRLGVSHQAPYKHFQNRNHLLGEAVGRVFTEMGDALERRPKQDHPAKDLGEIGRAYLAFASHRPSTYRFIYEFPVTDLAGFESVEAKASSAFQVLLSAVTRLTQVPDEVFNRECALFAWATVHGMASLSAQRILPSIGFFGEDEQAIALEDTMQMICQAIISRAAAFHQTSGLPDKS